MNNYFLTEYFKILEEEFVKFKSISNFSRSDDEFYEIISEIEDLCLKEEKYIDLFPKNIAILNDLSVSVHNFYSNDDFDEKFFVLMRFDNTLEVLKADVEKETVSDEILNDEFYDSYDLFNTSREHFMREFIIDTSSKFGYLSAFSIKKISDELILNNFDLSKIKLNDFNLENYFENLAIDVQGKITDLISLSEFANDSFVKEYNMEIFKYMLLKIRDYDFDLIRYDFENDKIYLNNISYFEILDMFRNAFNARIEMNNPVCLNVNMDLFDDLVSLIKLEEVLFSKYDSLNVSDLSCLNSISSLLEFEKEIVLKLDIDKFNSEILYDVISSDIHFFLVNDYPTYINKLISRRIKNLLPVFHNDVALGTFKKSYNEVVKNHIINSLCEYRDVICDVPSDKESLKYIQVYKNIVFEYPELLNDIIMLNYDFSTLFSFDDESNSKMLGFKNSIEYFYDKDNQLFELAKEIIKELSEILMDMEDNPELVSLYEFKICEFNDIINSVSTEHLYSLYDDISKITNDNVKKILLRKIDYAYKY